MKLLKSMKEIKITKQKASTIKKAYDNTDFLHSKDGRIIRIVSEYLHPEQDLRRKGVKGTIVFYGSARTLSREKFDQQKYELMGKIKSLNTSEKNKYELELLKLKHSEDITRCYEDGVMLSKMLSTWVKENPIAKGIHIASGGGGGMMEAANKGAKSVKSHSIGFNISLPFEQSPNHYISPDFNYEFHYFFMRKFWFVYLAKAIITMPGGFGTFDEIMEILTLKQTLKVTKPLPIVLYGKDFWKNAINFHYLVEKGVISKEDLSLFKICDTPEEAFNFITSELNNTLSKRTTNLAI